MLVVGLVALLLAGGCGGPTGLVGPSLADRAPGSPTDSAVPARSPAPSAIVSPPAAADSAPPSGASPSAAATAAAACVGRVFSGLSEGQRIGQLFLMGLGGDRLGPTEVAAIRARHIGSVWFTATTSTGVSGVRRITDRVQALATASATGRIGFLVAANQEGGRIQALVGPGFTRIPSALAQGRLAVGTLATDALTWGRALRAAGVDLDFAPVTDVVVPGTDAANQPIGALARGYGHDPATVGAHAAAFIAGMARAGVATTAKHFPGLGRVVGDTDRVAGVVDRTTTPTDPYLDAFRASIAARVPFVMVALATYTRIDPAHLAAFSPLVIDGLLRRDLGFAGVVMSDDLGSTAAVRAIPAGRRAIDFILAGGDLIVSKTAAATVAMAKAVAVRVATDGTFARRVDDAVRRVLRAKQAQGLLPCSG